MPAWQHHAGCALHPQFLRQLPPLIDRVGTGTALSGDLRSIEGVGQGLLRIIRAPDRSHGLVGGEFGPERGNAR